MKISFVPGKISDYYCYEHIIFKENMEEEGVLEIFHRSKQIQVSSPAFLLINTKLVLGPANAASRYEKKSP